MKDILHLNALNESAYFLQYSISIFTMTIIYHEFIFQHKLPYLFQ